MTFWSGSFPCFVASISYLVQTFFKWAFLALHHIKTLRLDMFSQRRPIKPSVCRNIRKIRPRKEFSRAVPLILDKQPCSVLLPREKTVFLKLKPFGCKSVSKHFKRLCGAAQASSLDKTKSQVISGQRDFVGTLPHQRHVWLFCTFIFSETKVTEYKSYSGIPLCRFFYGNRSMCCCGMDHSSHYLHTNLCPDGLDRAQAQSRGWKKHI